ncbi:HlyD family secretion protein [Acinetobacter sp. TY2]|uniref:HlyD family secretion protein n=1 Tax=unclassified Acinetobacter TaxID=196816 RepID=UPI00305CBED9
MTQDPNTQTPPNESVDEQSTTVDPSTSHSATDQLHHNLETDVENVSTDLPIQNTHAEKPSKYKILLLCILILVALGFIAFGLWKSYQPQIIDVQGRVEAETLHVSTKIPSRIEEIFVHDGQAIEKGQLLVTLSSPEIETKKQQALATLQSALALQSTVERGSQQENIDTLYANWQSLKAQENLAQTTYQRGQNLYTQGVISRQRRDEMFAAAQSAKELSEASRQQYLRAKRGSTEQQKSGADAQVEIAKAAVAEANALESETRLFSPIQGIVSKTYGKPTELVAIGVPIVSIIKDEKWVSLNIREDQYSQVYQAKSLEGYVPALNQNFRFQIKNIDAEGEFATIKTTRQSGGYDIRSFKIHLTPPKEAENLKVGMSVIFKLKQGSAQAE